MVLKLQYTQQLNNKIDNRSMSQYEEQHHAELFNPNIER